MRRTWRQIYNSKTYPLLALYNSESWLFMTLFTSTSSGQKKNKVWKGERVRVIWNFDINYSWFLWSQIQKIQKAVTFQSKDNSLSEGHTNRLSCPYKILLKFISVSSIQFLTFYNKISDHVELGPTLVLVLGKNYTVIQFAWSYSGTWTKSRDCCEWDPSEGSDLGGSAEVLFLIDFSCFRRSRVNSSSEQDDFRKIRNRCERENDKQDR